MIPQPTVTKGDRILLMGCIFSLIPIVLVLGFLLFVYTALNSCAHNGPLSVDSDSSPPPPAEQPAPESPPLPPSPPQATGGTDAPARPEPPPSAVVPPAPLPEEGGTPAPEGNSAAPQPPISSPLSPDHSPLPPDHSSAPHFRHIRWGMTPAEVLAAEAPALPVRTTPSTLVFDTETLDYPTRLAYSFRQGLLAAARLQFSLPSDDAVPALSPIAAHSGYLWLRAQLSDRYGTPTETQTTQPRSTTHLADRAARAREDAEQYAATLEAARRRLADRTARLREKYRKWPEAAARIDRELATERRYVADLESWLRDTQAAERDALSAIDQTRRDDQDSPLLATATATWHPSSVPHTVILSADFTTLPARLEIRYKTTLPLPDDL